MNIRAASLVNRHPVVSYFALTFSISWAGALAVASPYLLRGQAVPKFAGLLMFPAMLAGPSLSGIGLIALTEGRAGLRSLVSRIARVRIPGRWYAALLIPPALVFLVLVALESLVSPVFAPGRFWMGVLFGIPAGLFEEIGWMGYVYPKLSEGRSRVSAAVVLGALWGVWHLPVIDYLGTSTPHGAYLLPYFLAFCCAMTAMRVLIAWMYSHTESVWLAQLMHASSTGALVIFSPARVSAAQESLWYLAYGLLLWVAVAVVVRGDRSLRS